MKCSKCGEERREGWSFCLKCGTSFDESSRLSKYEEILANEALEENDEDIVDEVDLPFEDMYGTLSLEEETQNMDELIGRHLSKVEIKKETTVPVSAGNKKNTANDDDTKDSFFNKLFKNKTNLIITIAVGAVILIAVIVLCVSCVKENIDNNGKFNQYYELGEDLEEAGSLRTALTQYLKADQVAKNDEEKIQAKTRLWSIYSQLEGYDEELIQVLKELIEIDEDEVSYYDALIIVYQNLDMLEEIETLKKSVTDKKIKEHLDSLDTTAPVPNYQGGEYDKAISLELTTLDGYTIYYTKDGSTPTTESNVYEKAIKLKKEGTYEIRAISVSESGVKSNEFSASYVINFGIVDAPVVTPDSGTYTSEKRITVQEVADDINIYYTDDGTIPTKDSSMYIFESRLTDEELDDLEENEEKFEEGIEMPEGNTMFTFIAINEKGIASDPVVVIYYYLPAYTYSYDDALDTLSTYLMEIDIMENVYGEYDDGSYMYFYYETISEIEDEKYYIVRAEKENSLGKVKYSEYFAVGCDNGQIGEVNKMGAEYVFLED